MLTINDIDNKRKQHEKEVWIANRIYGRLLAENCTQNEYRNILKIVEERILGKFSYMSMEYEE